MNDDQYQEIRRGLKWLIKSELLRREPAVSPGDGMFETIAERREEKAERILKGDGGR